MKKLVILLALTILSTVSCSKKATYENRIFDQNSIENGYNSYWTVEKSLISPKLPVQNNLVTFHAIDYYKKPISGLNVVISVDPDNSAPELLTLTEVSTGIYQGSVAKDNNYLLTIEASSIKFMSNRNIGNVIVVDKDFCHVNNALSWTSYQEQGNGTLAIPYKICTVAQLNDIALNTDSSKISNNASDKHFIIMRDTLDVSSYLQNGGSEFIISSNTAQPFTGSFDGAGSEIKGFKSTASQAALFKHIAGATIKNLVYSYNYIGSNTSSAGGLVYEIQDSSVATNLTSIDFSGTVNLSSSLSFGGLVRKVMSSGVVNIQDIQGSVQITGHGTLAGLVSEVSGLGANPANINKVSVSGSYTNNDSSNTTVFAGLINSISKSNLSNSYASMVAVNPTKSSNKMAGLVNMIVDGSISNTYSTGNFQMVGVQFFGGLVGEQTNSQITNSFSVVNSTITSCMINCGKVLAKTYSGGSTVMLSLRTSNEASYVVSGPGSQTIVEGSEALSSSFYSSTTVPLSSWNFSTIWETESNNYPSLR